MSHTCELRLFIASSIGRKTGVLLYLSGHDAAHAGVSPTLPFGHSCDSLFASNGLKIALDDSMRRRKQEN